MRRKRHFRRRRFSLIRLTVRFFRPTTRRRLVRPRLGRRWRPLRWEEGSRRVPRVAPRPWEAEDAKSRRIGPRAESNFDTMNHEGSVAAGFLFWAHQLELELSLWSDEERDALFEYTSKVTMLVFLASPRLTPALALALEHSWL